MNQIAAIGDNGPPEPFDAIKTHIDDLYDEAKAWCDGEAITSQAQADDVSRLLDMIREAAKTADDQRKDENKPHDEAKAAVQAKYAPLIADTKSVTGKTVMAAQACKKALTPWLRKIDEENRAAAEKARLEAEEKARLAREAHQSAQSLEDMERAEESLKEAKQFERAAGAAEKAKAHATGGRRATTLRTVYRAEITNANECARWIWADHKDELMEFMQKVADREVKSRKADLPGVTCHKEQEAV